MLDTTVGVTIRNERDLKRFVNDHDGASPLDLVKAINIALELENNSEIAGQHHRLDAGRMLLKCKEKIEADGENWSKWQKGKFDRSPADLRKLMAMASAADPQQAANEAAERNQKHQATHRKKQSEERAYVSAHPIEHILKLVDALTDEQREELFTMMREKWQCQL